MADDFRASRLEKAFSPPSPPSPPLKPGDWPQNYRSSSLSELPTPYDGLDTNPNPHQPFHGVWPPPPHPPWLPTQMTTRSTTSAVIPASTAGLFQGGSDNALHNSTASMANRDMWNLSNVHIHLPHASHGGQGSPSLPQLLRQPFSIFSYVISTFATLIPHTTVTLDSQQYEAPYTIMPSDPPAFPPSVPANSCPDPNVLGSESDSTRAADAIPSQADAVSTEFGNLEITLLDDLDMSARHQPRAWYRSPDLPGGLSLDGIYIKKIYPSGHGYPCPNPCPLGPPVRIGDIGELTSTGFTTLANLFDCQLPVLQSQLASLALSDVWQEPEYFSEGESITGGVSVQNINHLPGSRVIQDITYRCHAPQGAILAVTSPAQLHTLAGDKTHRLCLWLCKHGMELLQFVDPSRTDPLYVVTGKVTSSSWASATYSEPLPEPDSSLVLTRFLHDLPPYQWTKPGAARSRSKSSSTVINPQGQRASDQCLFLRGFLLTPAPGYKSRQAQHFLNIGDAIPDPGTSEGHPDVFRPGGSGQGNSHFPHFPPPPSQSGSSARGSGQDDLLIEEIPSLSSVDFYPSHQINKRLLELTNADLAITHDDDWRLRLGGSRQTSLSGLWEGTVAGNPGMNATVKDHGSSFAENEVQSLEPVTPLQASANRWNRVSFATAADADSPEIVERKIKVLLRKLTMERFDTISDQIVAWANKSERERDCRTLIEVIRLIFVEATNEASLSEMYARLCRKIMEQISPKVQDEGIKNQEGKPIAGGQLFRKYLLNRCQEDFESGWAAKDATAAANSATDEAFKTSDLDKEEEVEPYSEEYYAAAKAKRQGLGLIKFIGELFRLQMLTERIMHECVKKLLGNVENPEEEEIESLCKLLTTIGHLLDVPKAQGQMDIYFLRMKELTKSNNISQRVHFMLQDVIEMRARKWVPLLKPTVPPAPITIAEVHENTLLEMAARDGEIMQHQMPMSRTAKAGSDPSNLGKVSKKGQLTSFGPSKTATKAEKRHPIPLTPHRMYSLNYNNYHNAASEPKPEPQRKKDALSGFPKDPHGSLHQTEDIKRTAAPRPTNPPPGFLSYSTGATLPSNVPWEPQLAYPTDHNTSFNEPRNPLQYPGRDVALRHYSYQQEDEDEEVYLSDGAYHDYYPGVLRPLHRVESRTRDRPLWDYQESSRDQYPHEIGRGASWSATKTNASSAAVPRSDSGGDEKDGAKIPPSMSEADAIKKIGEDCKELFAVRNIDKSENYFRTLPTKYHSKLVDRLGETILMSTIADAELVASIFDRASSKQLVDASAFEQGLAPHAELLKSSDFKSHGYRLLALMVNGAKLDAGARLRLGLAVHDLDSEFPLSLFYDPYSRNLDNPYYGNP